MDAKYKGFTVNIVTVAKTVSRGLGQQTNYSSHN